MFSDQFNEYKKHANEDAYGHGGKSSCGLSQQSHVSGVLSSARHASPFLSSFTH